jgi:hypothetical protein
VAAIIIATFVARYNPFTNWAGCVLEDVATGIFLGTERRRVVLGSA